MNRFYALAVSTVLAASMLTAPALAELPAERTITTQGHGETKVKPDSLSVNIMVEATHEQLPAARAENGKKMQAIIAALKGLNIPNLTLETQNVQVYPMQGEYKKDQLPKTIGYRVTNGLNVRVTKANPTQLGAYGSQIADTALRTGATHLQGMGFFLDDMALARQSALQDAIKNARQNAEAMAGAAGLTITGVHSIEGAPQYHSFSRNYMAETTMQARGGGVANQETPVEPGEETISSDVTVRFKF